MRGSREQRARSTEQYAPMLLRAPCSLLLALCCVLLAGACKTGTPVTATQAALDSADQVLIGMSHFVTDAGVLRAKVQADTAYFYSKTQSADLRSVHVTCYDCGAKATSP